MKLKILENNELLNIAKHVLGTRDGVRPIFPRTGEAIQGAMEAAARAQDRRDILLVIQDWERCANPETENGEEEFTKKYGKGTTELIDIIEESVR